MAELEERPFPPGDYPVVVVGSGPGGLQSSYFLSRLGIRHALLSADPAPGGMFRHFPFFQRLLSWTKPYAPVDRKSRAYEWYDWNSLLALEPDNRAIMPGLMDGTSSFPSRPEMEQNLVSFAERTGLPIRYQCRWESTSREGDRFVLGTSDGEYRAQACVFAVGVAEPWKPDTPGFEHVPHYVETRAPETYAGKRLFIVGKQNSGFELASGLLPWAQRIVLASPRPVKLSVNTHSLLGIRARYIQPVEDEVLGGGVFMLDASIARVERFDGGVRIHCVRSEGGGELVVEADEVIAATGFTAPLRDLPDIGVSVFGQSRLPSLTNYWESVGAPGIYFAGTIGQAAAGMKKYGLPSNSGAVHGSRYNARTMIQHLAEKHFGVSPERRLIEPSRLVDYLLEEGTTAPELWNQKSYLARAVSVDPRQGLRDEGIVPLADFVDREDSAAVAITVETDDTGNIHPAVYVREAGRPAVETLLESHPLHDFRTVENRARLASLLKGVTAGAVR
ncbi:MAG TPA: NAD(P)-binding domain-containing protein [Candidatus Caenarcaniphilales bacterium]|nr:NAD(P)-binding domain-containing protein [Candidatus Caenarcaniphilales bacterium]